MAWDFWVVCIPIVVVGAPLGAIVISRCSRGVLLGLLLTSISVQYIAALILVPQSVALVGFNLAVVSTGAVVFFALGQVGQRRTGDRLRSEPGQ